MYRPITAVMALAWAARAAVVSTTVAPTVVTSTADDCSTRTVCADYINDCGVMYGGCFADCTPWPTFTPPPCPGTTSSAVSSVATPTADDCRTRTVCADYVNDCGMWYGGCFADCTPWPTFTPPPCPSSSSSGGGGPASPSNPGASVTPTSSRRRPCSKPSPATASKPCGGDTACTTSYRDCSTTQLPFGGCWPACSPQPLFTPPPCPVSPSSA